MIAIGVCSSVQVSTDIVTICHLDLINCIISAIGILFLGLGFIYLLTNSERRCPHLMYFHNLRSGTLLFLLLMNICEIGSSTLAQYPPIGYNVISPVRLISSWLSLIFTIFMVGYFRIVEIRDKKAWLYLTIILEMSTFIIKLCKLIEVMESLDGFHLESMLIESNVWCMVLLTFADSFTIYQKSNTSKGLRSSGSNENIVYKYSTSTFFSKITFWWITPLLWRGYFEPLELEDLGNLTEDDTSRSHYDQFLIIYQSHKNKKTSLWLCYLKSSWKMFSYGGLLKLFGDLAALVGPLSITNIVDYIEISNNSSTLISNSSNYSRNNIDRLNLNSTLMSNSKTNITLNNDSTKFMFNNNSIYYPDWYDFIKNGWIMGILVLIASLAQGSFSQASTHIVNMVGIRLRTSIQGLIYRKTLLISSSCLFGGGGGGVGNKIDNINTIIEDGTKGEKSNHLSEDKLHKNQNIFDAGTITNLMSEDALNVMSFFWIAHYVWAIPLKISVVMYFLYQKLGISAIIGAMVCVITMIPLQFIIGKKMSSNAKNASECTDERLKRINEVLIGIKIIKLNAWEKVFTEKIQSSRQKELKYLIKDSIYWTLMTFLTHVSSVLITFVTLAVFISIEGENVEFTASRVFAALALFNQMTVPLFIFPITVPIIISAIVSTKRLMMFLDQPEVQKEFEGIKNMARILSRSDASLDVYERETTELTIDSEENSFPLHETDEQIYEQNYVCNNEYSSSKDIVDREEEQKAEPQQQQPQQPQSRQHKDEEKLEIKILPKQKSCTKVKLKKNNHLSKSTKLERNRLRQKSMSKEFQMDLPQHLVVCINKGIFKWKTNSIQKKDFLTIDNLDIPKGKLTTIVGKSGSGKTSLLAALLKEMHISAGTMVWNKYSTIAYVPQNPWLLNASIRDNILFGESYRPKRYQKVLDLCALLPDIELMPCGDMAEIGERGINLSGGQKQRIAIARALYSSANVIIMDDPLSSLDNEVAKWIFDNSIKKMLLKHKRTVIFVTQKTHFVHGSDNIIAMENNRVRASGTYAEIAIVDSNLAQDWNSIIDNENSKDVMASPGKTARERWKLFKNVSRIGLQRISVTDEENLSVSQTLYVPKRRSGCLFESRHLTYDMPFPIDECQTDGGVEFRRRPSRRDKQQINTMDSELHKDAFRTNSLEVDSHKLERMPVVRNVSSPTSLQNTYPRSADFDFPTKNVNFRQFLHRMSSRKSNSSIKNSMWHRPISTSNSIKSSSRESHPPLKRLVSNISKYSEETTVTEDDVCSNYNEKISTNRLIYDEERKYGKIPNRIYMLYLRSCGLYVVLVFCLSAFGWQALRIFTDVWLRGWTDIDYNNDGTETLYYFKIFGLLSIFCICLSMVSTPAGQLAGYRASIYLHEQLLNSIMKCSLNFFQTTPLGRVMNRFSNDITIIDKKIATTSQRLLQFILLCLSAVLINTAITPWFILLTIPICGVYYMVQRFYRNSSRELQRIESITSSPIISHFSESIQGVTSIRAYNQESRFMEILFKRIEANNVAFIILNTSNRWLGIALDYLGGVIVFVAIITALLTAHLYPEKATPSLVGLAINYTLLVPIYLNWVVKLLSDMEMYVMAVERIVYYVESENSNNICKENYLAVPISWPHKGNIFFENVSIRYETQTENVITNLNLKIEAGQRLGICGRTGSGKSTLAMSLFRFAELIEGRILIDDVDISTIHTDEIRTRLSIIPQDVVLFDGTIRENLDPRNHYTELELWNSLEIAQLKEVITAFPLGLETKIIDNGSNLSAGQRQLFSLARSVLKGSVCLVLDEATSALDTETELALLNAANKAFQGRTIITIAHRLSTILNYDRIIVLENGKIVEDGDPNELKSKIGGKFAAMLNATYHYDR